MRFLSSFESGQRIPWHLRWRSPFPGPRDIHSRRQRERLKPPHLAKRSGLGPVEVQLNSVVTNIGSDSDCDIRLENQGASKHHATIALRGFDRYTVQDLDSTTGTFVNGHRVDRRVQLRNGDTIAFGRAEFVFHDTTARFRRPTFPFITFYVAGLVGLILAGVLVYVIFRGIPRFR